MRVSFADDSRSDATEASLISPFVNINQSSCLRIIYTLSTIDLSLRVSLETKDQNVIQLDTDDEFFGIKAEYLHDLPIGDYRLHIKVEDWEEIPGPTFATIEEIQVLPYTCPKHGNMLGTSL